MLAWNLLSSIWLQYALAYWAAKHNCIWPMRWRKPLLPHNYNKFPLLCTGVKAFLYSRAVAKQLFYTVEGDGEPVVLLHGYLASSHYFKRVRRQLSRTHRVVSIDLLGFGRSPKVDSDYTYDAHVAAVHETLQHLGIKKFALVGHSLGALIALRYSLTHPSQVRQLVLLNPPMYVDAAQALAALKATGLHYRIMLHSRYKDAAWAATKMLPRFPFNKRRPAINLTDMLRVSPVARRLTYQHVILAGEFFADINRVHVSTLLVVGARDRPEYSANALHHTLPAHVNAVTVPTGHHLPAQRPGLAAWLVRRALS